MFELEISLSRGSQPFRVTGVASAERVREIIESFLAAWGIPAPRSLDDTPTQTFAELIQETGEYRCDAQDYRIVAKLSA